MIKHHKLSLHTQDLIREAIAYLRARPDIQFAYLFGSFGRGKPLPLSDVDIAVYFADISDVHEKRMEILGALMHLLQTDELDLVILNRAPLTLRMKVLEHKKIVVDHAPFLRHQYESLTLREYFDFAVRERAILERRFLHG